MLQIVDNSSHEGNVLELALSIKYKLQERVFLIGLLKHREIMNYYYFSDIFVSVNFPGGLSNTVLEAMRYGCCILRLAPDTVNEIDIHTGKYLPTDLQINFSREDPEVDLVIKIEKLLSDTKKIFSLATKTKKWAEEKIWSWDERIDYEIEKYFDPILNQKNRNFIKK